MEIDSSPGLLPPSSNRFPTQSSQTPTRSNTTGRSRPTRTAALSDDELNPFNNAPARNTRGAFGGGAGRDGFDGRMGFNSMDDGIPGSQAEEDGVARGAGPRRPGGRARMNLDVPPVRDATGEKVMESFEVFLRTYSETVTLPSTPTPDDSQPMIESEYPYIDQIKAMRYSEITTLYIDFSHLLTADDVLARAIRDQYYRFLPYLRRALLNLIRELDPAYLYLNPLSSSLSTPGQGQVREFSIAFYHLPLLTPIRELKTSLIGSLLSISGTVTRTSEVRPELLYGTFKCELCGGLVSNIEQQFSFTHPSLCPNPLCNNRHEWDLQLDQSVWTDWQKIRLQESPSEIPTGSMPRSLDVIIRGEGVERAKAGDRVVVVGCFVVVPDVGAMGLPGTGVEVQREQKGQGRATEGVTGGVTGLKTLGVRDLLYKTAFLACMVSDADGRATNPLHPSEEESEDPTASFAASLTAQELEELKGMVNSEYVYSRLVESIAPTIYGHEIVKKGLLLQLMGGVHKKTKEGINLRGDINICIVGDPGVSKSQFLKYITSFLPRSVYTSGKASSAAGLTAAVVKDEETGEFTIEAGALMLADNGICAIDEFDKMEVSDQVAIHEAMEQQTISIAKAGIHATLNARTSLLAAANPVGGRYDRKKSLRANVMMSAPIMSRFDLFFVILDEPSEERDKRLARHIVDVHRLRDEAVKPEFTTEQLQRYIGFARTFNPKFTPEAADLLVAKYRALRQDDASGTSKNSYRITVRQLESMIRLSEAIARANCTAEIIPEFVKEAYGLLRMSIISVEREDVDLDEDEGGEGGGGEANRVGSLEAGGSGGMELDETIGSSYSDPHVPASPTSPSRGPASTTQPTLTQSIPPPPPPLQLQPKKKVKITYDKYMTLQSLIVLHLGEIERSEGRGEEREALIDWYLEKKEEEGVLGSLEELEGEKELIGRVLNKLVKDHYLIAINEDVMQSQEEGAQESLESVPGERRIVYMVHPSVDADSSSFA